MTVHLSHWTHQPPGASAGRIAARALRSAARAGRAALRCTLKGAGWSAFFLILLAALVLPEGDRRNLTPAGEAALGHRYALISWEFANFPAKWLHRIYTAMPWSNTSLEQRRADLDGYQELVKSLREVRSELELAPSRGAQPDETAGLQAALDGLLAELDRLRPSVEEYLESVISSVVEDHGLDAGWLVWPPVDFRLDDPPLVLAISPRDRIERQETVLITPGIPVEAMERIEGSLLAGRGLSAIVEATGGLATYPTVVGYDRDLLQLLEVAAHEWLHSYLFFHPLGQKYEASQDMTTLNETLADMAGRELGGMAYSKITGKPAPPLEPPRDPSTAPPLKPGEFDFFPFMRETRLHTEELLKAGDIPGAERYMEERRVELNSHGYRVRKINQAYFAFHGSYGENPSSVSPIARELYELRSLSSGAGEFVKLMRGVSSYEEFREVLAKQRKVAGATAVR